MTKENLKSLNCTEFQTLYKNAYNEAILGKFTNVKRIFKSNSFYTPEQQDQIEEITKISYSVKAFEKIVEFNESSYETLQHITTVLKYFKLADVELGSYLNDTFDKWFSDEIDREVNTGLENVDYILNNSRDYYHSPFCPFKSSRVSETAWDLIKNKKNIAKDKKAKEITNLFITAKNSMISDIQKSYEILNQAISLASDYNIKIKQKNIDSIKELYSNIANNAKQDEESQESTKTKFQLDIERVVTNNLGYETQTPDLDLNLSHHKDTKLGLQYHLTHMELGDKYYSNELLQDIKQRMKMAFLTIDTFVPTE